ncbi:hypothetical protein EX895_005943 [Sporisorium graminicola]|uniref:Beta-catenin-like protein 1 N-terminal domain-containing protein n=1 Tax=Sporisorium graminicola TaxID=280036 RepID=A0A4U7KLL0_9BASI|nr:hypothetical protein EX895_005943 [Sporisorium graminicola]TKY84863.1 hypothetical protein EX895_005943 [Sporisorium graminicola]
MDVGKLFKLPELSSGAVNKRKWNAPKPDDPAASTSASTSSSAIHTEAGPPDPSSSRPRKAARVDDDVEDNNADNDEPVEETHFFSDDDQEDGRFFGGGLTAEQQQILDIMDSGEQASSDPSTVNDLPALRKQLLRFERSINKNAEMRVKHAQEPARFIDSEADLDAELKSLLVLTTQPVLFYSEFVKLGGAASLVGLLSHENADIAAAAIEVIEELTDDDVLDQANAQSEGEDDDDADKQNVGPRALAAMNELVEALLQQSLLDLLVSNLSRFNDHLEADLPAEEAATRAVEAENDAQAIYHTLGAIENLVSSRSAVSEQLVSSTPFLPWVLKRLAAKRAVDQNTNYAAELLAILLQSSEPNRAALGSTRQEEENGIDVLLGVLARYRRTAPSGAEEQEFVENIFDSLCSSLSDASNKARFLEGEGIELMVLLMKEKKSFGRTRAVKVLDHACSGPSGSAVCHRIVDAQALSPLFSIFMQCNAGKRSSATAQTAEHLLGIFASLLTHLPSDSIPRIRVLSKFVADNYMRTDHLLDLRDSLTTRLDAIPPAPETDEDEQDVYLSRLEHGLFSLQLLDTVLAWLVMEDDACKDHVGVMLKRKGARFANVAETLREYSENVGDQVAIEAADGEEGFKTRDILTALIAYLESL